MNNKLLITCFSITIILSLLSSIISQTQSRSTTYDSDFIQKYKPKFLRSGDNQTYAINGDNITVHYNGTFPTTGVSFDSSYSRNQPFSFFLNFGNVIKCWDNVLARMSLGQRIYVVCPFYEAYGTAGTTNVPGSTDIAFDIDFLCVNNNCQPKAVVVTPVMQQPKTNVVASNSGSFVHKNCFGFVAVILALFVLLL